jgi:type IV secretion system protein VirB9
MKMLSKNLFRLCSLVVFLYAGYCSGLGAAEPITMDSRVKTYIYNPNEVFPIVLHYGYHTHIDFPKSEFVTSIIVGNPSDWDINNRGNRIFLQTYSKRAHTNMTVITNKRTYEFDLLAKENLQEADYDLAYSIKFYYPEEEKPSTGCDLDLMTDQPGVAVNQDTQAQTFEIRDLIKGNVNSNYVYFGDQDLAPLVTFNDSRFTYLKFGKNCVVPKIDVISNKKQKVKIFRYNGYIVLDNVFARIKLSSKDRRSALLVNKALG